MKRSARRDSEILDTLRTKVRVLSLHQVRRTWWSEKSRLSDVKRQLAVLPVEFRSAQLSFVPLLEPVLSWSPETPRYVNFDRLAYKLEKRWKNPRPGVVVYAADSRPPKNSEIIHDVHVGELYLQHFFRDHPDAWQHEDALCHTRGERPDAIVRAGAPDGTDLLIDFGGRYSASKLRRKHDAFRHAHYQIW